MCAIGACEGALDQTDQCGAVREGFPEDGALEVRSIRMMNDC